MKTAASCGPAGSPKEALTGPSIASVGNAPGNAGKDAGTASQMRPHSVSVWVGSPAEPEGAGFAEPPGTAVGSDAFGVAPEVGFVPGDPDVVGVAGGLPQPAASRTATARAATPPERRGTDRIVVVVGAARVTGHDRTPSRPSTTGSCGRGTRSPGPRRGRRRPSRSPSPDRPEPP